MIRILPILLLVACTTGAGAPKVTPDPAAPVIEASSVAGKPPAPPSASVQAEAQRDRDLEAARAEYEKSPTADNLVWIGRRLAYLGRYDDAINIFTEGAETWAEDARFLRHRGHRYITTREFDKAIADLEKATLLTLGKRDEVEPDGLPNARNTPIGSLQSNICYHLGLAHYLKGDFESALPIYQRCVAEASNPDRLVASSHWLYMTLRRLGRPKDAEAILEAINPGLDVIENFTYHKLLLMYRGEIAEDELSKEPTGPSDAPGLLYGIGNWRLYNGDPVGAEVIFRRITASDAWASFGTIAAEAELKRGVR